MSEPSNLTIVRKACEHVNDGQPVAGKRQYHFPAKNEMFITSLCVNCFPNSLYGDEYDELES